MIGVPADVPYDERVYRINVIAEIFLSRIAW